MLSNFTALMRGFSIKILSFAIAVMAIQLLSSSASGQSTSGSFTGIVRDPTGAAVPTCIVSLVNKGTSIKRDVVTGADGTYLFVNVDAGVYDLIFQAPGFSEIHGDRL